MSAMHARVRLTASVEVTVDNTWENGCTLAMVYQDAQSAARNILEKALRDHPKARLVGGVKTEFVITENT